MNFLTFNKIIFSYLKKGKLGVIQNYSRYAEWKKYLSAGHGSLPDELPWLTFDAIYFIRKNISHNDVVFEYGGGGSTLFFLKNAGKVVTVEHDKTWFEKLKDVIATKNAGNWEGHFILAEINNVPGKKDISNPDDYASDDPNFSNANFREYVCVIDKYPDNYFDWILIDGRARTSCLSHSFSKLKPGGFLILDNAERKYYTMAHKRNLRSGFTLVKDKFGAIPFTETFSQTNIWKKRL